MDGGASQGSTVWRQVASTPVAIRCQAVDSGARPDFHRLATGGYGQTGGQLRACFSIDMSDRQARRRIGTIAYPSLTAIWSLGCFLCVLCAFAVRPTGLDTNQDRQKEVSRQGFTTHQKLPYWIETLCRPTHFASCDNRYGNMRYVEYPPKNL